MSLQSKKIDTVVFLGSIIGCVGFGGAGFLASTNHLKIGVWVGFASAVTYTTTGYLYICLNWPKWKKAAKLTALLVSAVLLLISIWLHRSSNQTQPTKPHGEHFNVESFGNQSPNIVDNEGIVTINNHNTPSSGKLTEKDTDK